jgi:hypothetical protein
MTAVRQRSRRLARWSAVAVLTLLAVIYVANVRFYSGASVGELFSWRMEHGRLTLKRSPVTAHRTFYVAGNTEGLRFAFEGNWRSTGDWRVSIPLWAPLLLAGGWVAWVWRPSRKVATA